MDIRDVKFGRCIGSSCYGDKYIAQHRTCGPVTLRCVEVNASVDGQRLAEEAQKMRWLHHTNILQLMAVIHDGQKHCIVYEPASYGSLKAFMLSDRNKLLPSVVKLSFMHDIVLGMSYIHNQNPAIYHGYLSWKHIQVSDYFRLKISDFGVQEWQRMVNQTSLFTEDSVEYKSSRDSEEKADVLDFAFVCWCMVTLQECDPNKKLLLSNFSSALLQSNALVDVIPNFPNWLQIWTNKSADLRPGFTSIKDEIETFVKRYSYDIEDAKINLLQRNRLYDPNNSTLANPGAAYNYIDSHTESNCATNSNINIQSVQSESKQRQFDLEFNSLSGRNVENSQLENIDVNGSHIHVHGVQHLQIGKDNVLNITASGKTSKQQTQPHHSTSVSNVTSKHPVSNSEAKKKKVVVTCSKKKLDRVNMEMLANDVGSDWKRLARRLRFTEGELDQLTHDNQQLYEQVYQMLRQWVERYDGEATLCAVADALIHIKRVNVAAKLNDTL